VFQKHYAKYADVDSDPFIALNTALASGGIFIHVAKSAVIETPIHILNITSVSENTILNSRNLIVIGENAQAKIIESFVTVDSKAKAFNNSLTEIVIDAAANLQHYKIQDETELGYLMNTTQAYQKKQSVFTTNNFILSGSLVRNNLTIVLDDEFIETHLNGLYLTKGNQTVDNHTLVDHRKPNCNSNELYKGIIEEKSAATFNGKIYVRKDAQKTNAFQSNKNILLSDDGTINTKPQLEIYADDVKCSHGTSTGKLDEDKIFYLRARGLSEASAKKLLMYAFASEVVDCIKIDELKEYVEERISERFQ
jgi:Fe-S cluster assembly protein SufD